MGSASDRKDGWGGGALAESDNDDGKLSLTVEVTASASTTTAMVLALSGIKGPGRPRWEEDDGCEGEDEDDMDWGSPPKAAEEDDREACGRERAPL